MPWPLSSGSFVVGYTLLSLCASYLLGVLLAARLMRWTELSQRQLALRSALALLAAFFFYALLAPPSGSIVPVQPIYASYYGIDWPLLAYVCLSIFAVLLLPVLLGLWVLLPRNPLGRATACACGGVFMLTLQIFYLYIVCIFEPGQYWGWY